ncbi:hypothetical protein [Cupriavidus necator]
MLKRTVMKIRAAPVWSSLAAAWLAAGGLLGTASHRVLAGQICDAPYVHDGGQIRFEADG